MTTPHNTAILAFRVIVKLATLLLTLFLCSMSLGQDVKVKFSPESDFSKYHTYKWVKVSHSAQVGTVNKDIDEDIKRTVDSEMSQKHFVKVEDSGPADLFLVAQIAVKEEHQWAGLDPHHPASWMTENPNDMTVEVGTVVLDFYDSARHLLWHGRANETFDKDADLDTIHKNTAKAVTKIIERFPPKR